MRVVKDFVVKFVREAVGIGAMKVREAIAGRVWGDGTKGRLLGGRWRC